MYNQPGLKKIVNTALVNLTYNTESDRLIDPVKYVLSMGGKRLRPVLALMACNLFSDKIGALEDLSATLVDALDRTIGLRVHVRLVEPQTIQRSEGKAKRVVDRRNLET